MGVRGSDATAAKAGTAIPDTTDGSATASSSSPGAVGTIPTAIVPDNAADAVENASATPDAARDGTEAAKASPPTPDTIITPDGVEPTKDGANTLDVSIISTTEKEVANAKEDDAEKKKKRKQKKRQHQKEKKKQKQQQQQQRQQQQQQQQQEEGKEQQEEDVVTPPSSLEESTEVVEAILPVAGKVEKEFPSPIVPTGAGDLIVVINDAADSCDSKHQPIIEDYFSQSPAAPLPVVVHRKGCICSSTGRHGAIDHRGDYILEFIDAVPEPPIQKRRCGWLQSVIRLFKCCKKSSEPTKDDKEEDGIVDEFGAHEGDEWDEEQGLPFPSPPPSDGMVGETEDEKLKPQAAEGIVSSPPKEESMWVCFTAPCRKLWGSFVKGAIWVGESLIYILRHMGPPMSGHPAGSAHEEAAAHLAFHRYLSV